MAKWERGGTRDEDALHRSVENRAWNALRIAARGPGGRMRSTWLQCDTEHSEGIEARIEDVMRWSR